MKTKSILSIALLATFGLAVAPAFADTGAVTTPGASTSSTEWTSNTGVTFNAPGPTTPLPPITLPTEPPTIVNP